MLVGIKTVQADRNTSEEEENCQHHGRFTREFQGLHTAYNKAKRTDSGDCQIQEKNQYHRFDRKHHEILYDSHHIKWCIIPSHDHLIVEHHDGGIQNDIDKKVNAESG